ncbi:MAG: hypothetical protein ACJ75H_14390, partial [Thermoanaerobaculia bacterium]
MRKSVVMGSVLLVAAVLFTSGQVYGQCIGENQSRNPSHLKSNDFFEVLNAGTIQVREGVTFEEVKTPGGQRFLRFSALEQDATSVAVDCTCPIANPFVSNCWIYYSDNVARCIGSCQNDEGANYLCRF